LLKFARGLHANFAGALLDRLSIPHSVDQFSAACLYGLLASAELTEVLRPLIEMQRKRLRVRFRAIGKSVTRNHVTFRLANGLGSIENR
jgi:histidinol-phosphate/aromatic aminotransferase/cobyric acid decarboxylase-like protein